MDKKYKISLWQFDFEPYASIDDLPNHHEFVKDIYFNSKRSFNKIANEDDFWNNYEGMTYEFRRLDDNYLIARGVFESDSVDDDFRGLA